MARVVWKGAIVFGIVHIPVDLYPGSRASSSISTGSTGATGAPSATSASTRRPASRSPPRTSSRATRYEDGTTSSCSRRGLPAANPKATQTVEIVAFVDAGAIEPQYLRAPYRLVPGQARREGLRAAARDVERTGRTGVAQVVIRTKQHLAALVPVDEMLVLVTLRYGRRDPAATEFEFPPAEIRKAGVGERELDIATRLVDDMTEDWDPARFHDTYREDLMARIEKEMPVGRHADRRCAGAEGQGRGDRRRARSSTSWPR